MTLTPDVQQRLYDLKEILAQRLHYNMRWNNIMFRTRSTYFEWTWFDSQEYDDPHGRLYYETLRLSPLNLKRVEEAIERQQKKLKRDKRRTERSDLG